MFFSWTFDLLFINSSTVSGKLPPRKIAPRSGSGFGLGLTLELGPGGGAIFLEPSSIYTYCLKFISHHVKEIFL